MSAQETAAPTSSGLKAGTIVRITLILLGIMSATLLAHSAFGIRFNEDFLLLLDIVRDFIGFVILPFELLIVKPVVRWLHEQGWVFELHDHWRNAFVLLWLFYASQMREFASLSLLLGREGVGESIMVAFRWAWAALAALIGGALAGTVALDHPAVLWWPVMAYFLHRGGDQIVYALKNRLHAANGALALVFALPLAGLALGWMDPPTVARQPPHFWWAVAAFFAYQTGYALIWVAAGREGIARVLFTLFIATASGALALGVLEGPAWLDFRHSPSPGLAYLATFVAVLAAWYLIQPVLQRTSVRGQRRMRTALDVFTVLGGAALSSSRT